MSAHASVGGLAGLAGTVLVVDDDTHVLQAHARVLTHVMHATEMCSTPEDAIRRVARGGVDVIVSDVEMPGMSGTELLRRVRAYDDDLPVILVTGAPAVDSAAEAVEYGAFNYLVKPVSARKLQETVERAAQLYRLALMKRRAFDLLGTQAGASDRAGLEASFERALDKIWIAYQPIVRASDRSVFGYEALLRSDEPSLPGPGQLLDAATRLGELGRLGRAIRAKVLEPFGNAPPGPAIFVNLHPQDLLDPELLDADSWLSRSADRIVLEITERASLGDIENIRSKIARLREMGFRIAVDDLGAGYAGLTSFALLEPEIVKLDMSLVRDIDKNPVKQQLVETMSGLCRNMGLLIVAEGIETSAERDVLEYLGCDLFQGYLFARPGRAFPRASWDSELLGDAPSCALPKSGSHKIPSVPDNDPVRNITTEVETERSNAGSRMIPLFVLDSLGDGIVLTNARGRIVYSNKATDTILGVKPSAGPPAEWPTHYGVYYPDRWQLFPVEQYPLVRALRGEETNNVELRIRNESVKDVLISVTGRPLRDGSGAVVGACVVIRDITAVRQAERNLEQLNAELTRTNAELLAFCQKYDASEARDES